MQLYDITGFKLPEEDICHHGIKGQKWGVRRYQNPDGSLTELGKKRRRQKESEIEEKLNMLAKSIPNATREGSYVVVKSTYNDKTSYIQFDPDVNPDRAKNVAKESNKILDTMVSELKRITQENPDQKTYVQDLSDGKTADEIFDNLNEYYIDVLPDGWGLVLSVPSGDLDRWITIETDDKGRTRWARLRFI